MGTPAVTLDMSTAQPIQTAPVKLDMSTAQPIKGMVIGAPPQPPSVDMQESGVAHALANSPSNADPHNPGNIPPEVMNQMSPEDREQAQAQQFAGAAATAIPGSS